MKEIQSKGWVKTLLVGRGATSFFHSATTKDKTGWPGTCKTAIIIVWHLRNHYSMTTGLNRRKRQ
jgi:hypothetical protein